jgi:hypothetical protein
MNDEARATHCLATRYDTGRETRTPAMSEPMAKERLRNHVRQLRLGGARVQKVPTVLRYEVMRPLRHVTATISLEPVE